MILPEKTKAGRLNKSNSDDAFAITLMKKKIPGKFKSYPVVQIYEHRTYKLKDNIILENEDENSKEVIFEMIYHGFSYIQTEKGISRSNLETQYAGIGKKCDSEISEVFKSDGLSGKEMVDKRIIAYTLIVRYIKRVNAHLKNVATAVVNPFHRIGFRRSTP